MSTRYHNLWRSKLKDGLGGEGVSPQKTANRLRRNLHLHQGIGRDDSFVEVAVKSQPLHVLVRTHFNKCLPGSIGTVENSL